MILVPFMKQNACNNSRKDGKFGTDLVSSIIKPVEYLYNKNVVIKTAQQKF